MTGEKKIKALFQKYIDQTISAEELALLQAFFDAEQNDDNLNQLLQEYFYSESFAYQELQIKSAAVEALAWDGIQNRISDKHVPVFYKNPWFIKLAVAAGLLFLLSISFYFIHEPSYTTSPSLHAKIDDIQPGTNRATLTAANGVAYNLNGEKKEIVTENGLIRYKDGETLGAQSAGQMVTLSTPRGGQFRVVLADGTEVWLNAASSLSYPTTFKGKERRVQLSGEAYFQVTHNAKQPFIISTENQQVKVLGTSFNLKAYRDEQQTVTTLVNGSVELKGGVNASSAKLHPGEQAVFDQAGYQIKEVDAALYGAWKDGEFKFKATPLVDVLHQIERWYDLDIDYTGIPTGVLIHASINRNKKLSTVLDVLEKISDLKFDVKGRRVKLMN